MHCFNHPGQPAVGCCKSCGKGLCVVFCLSGFLPLLVSGDTGTLFMGILGLFFAAYGVTQLLKKSQYFPTTK